MKLLIEGYHYREEAIEGLGRLMGDLTWRDGKKSRDYVGYYYSAQLGDCVFFLPKVVLDEQGLLFGRYDPNEVVDIRRMLDDKLSGQDDYRFLYGFTVWLYRGLKEFVRLNPQSGIVKMRDISTVGQQGEQRQNTYLDIMLSLLRFHEENPDYFTFIVKNMHRGLNKVNWTKTISRSEAVMQGRGEDSLKRAQIYLNPVNKRKVVNYDEELLVIFYSILDYMRRVYGFDIRVDYHFNLLSEVEFENWIDYYGAVRMKQIRYKYFSDKDLQLWNLCNAFFERAMHIRTHQEYKDYLIVTRYNVVFESMVDELLSDKGLATGDLKEQEDGKRVDHIYAYQGLINKDRIYYIGDSKYYNIGGEMGRYSVYKQYTYARNVIQHNLSLFLEDEKDEKGRRKHVGQTYLIYRDEDTDGYSITPNFFISARIDEDVRRRDYYLDNLKARNDVESIRHFENRLFDRDTLLLQHYDINFLYVLSLYAQANDGLKQEFRQKTRNRFRENILAYLSENYQFFSLQLKASRDDGDGDEEPSLDAMHRAIEKHFRGSIGKVFRPYSDEKFMYVALEPKVKYYEENHRLLAALSEDFNIRHYTLDTNPTDEINKFYELESTMMGVVPDVLKEQYVRLSEVENEVFLIGGWRRDKNQLAWIRERMLYNVRKRDRRGSRDGMQRIEERVVAARYLLLYEIGAETTACEVYRISSHHVRTAEQLAKKGYPNPTGNYFVYDLELMARQFEPIDIQRVLTDEFLAEAERRRKAGTAKMGWEEEWIGTPVYKTGREIMKVLGKG